MFGFFLESKTLFWAGRQVYVEIRPAWRKKVADLPPKEPKTKSAPEGVEKLYNDDYDDDDDDDDDDGYPFFL